MNCTVCHDGQTEPGTTTATFRRDGRTIVVNEVPADVCKTCSEAYVAEDVTTQVLAIVAEAPDTKASVLVRYSVPNRGTGV